VNKMLVVPLIVGMAFLAIAITGGILPEDPELQDQWGTYIDEDGIERPIELPEQAEEESFSLMSAEGIMAVLAIAIAVGIVAGVTVFSSGISELSQAIIFQTTVYLAIWAVLSMAMYEVIQDVPYLGPVLWLTMTLLYCLGVIMEIRT